MKNLFVLFVLMSINMIGHPLFSSNMYHHYPYENISENNDGELTIAKVGKPISAELKSRLLNAFKAQYGLKIKVDAIELITFRNEMWLVFQSGDRSTPTVALKLEDKKGNYVLNAATSVVNTCTGDPCSHCKFSENSGCYCNQGGGSSVCNHTMTTVTELDRFMASLEI